MPTSLEHLRDFLRDDIKNNAFTAVLAVGAAVLTAVALAVWSALAGHTGPQIALYSLLALASVLVSSAALAYLSKAGVFGLPWVKTAARIVGMLLLFALARWFVNLVGEISALRAASQSQSQSGSSSPVRDTATENKLRDELRGKDDSLRQAGQDVLQARQDVITANGRAESERARADRAEHENQRLTAQLDDRAERQVKAAGEAKEEARSRGVYNDISVMLRSLRELSKELDATSNNRAVGDFEKWRMDTIRTLRQMDFSECADEINFPQVGSPVPSPLPADRARAKQEAAAMIESLGRCRDRHGRP